MAALLRRAVLVVIPGLALLALAGSALAGGRDILDDYRENRRIDGCYIRAEFREAQRLVRDDERLYAELPDVLDEAQISNVSRPGEPCGAARTVPAQAVDDDPGVAPGLWIGLAAAAVAAGGGAAAWARRGRGDAGS